MMARIGSSMLLTIVVAPLAAQDPARLELKPGDRIVLIGNTLAEREQYFGHWETLWHSRFPRHKLVVRNLGWSADELTLRPRSASFQDHGHNLSDHQPDVVFACFGFNESFAGKAGLKKFEADLDQFITKTTTTKYNGKNPPTLVLFSPIAHEDVGRPGVTDGKENNQNLQLYTDAMRQLARKRGVRFVDLFNPTRKLMESARNAPSPPGGEGRVRGKLTFNGIHLTDHGYRVTAPIVDEALFGPRPDSQVNLDQLRKEILERNQQFFYDHRAVNGYYIYGGRKNPFGVVNFPGEFAKLRKMIANRDQRIWAVAQSQTVPAEIDDSNTGALKKIPTNYKGQVLITPPDEAAKKFTLPAGFEINLFASEQEFPALKKPCQMAFDSRGRLWVCTIPSYPQYLPGEPVDDKILILEDSDGDGKADRQTVFADKLYLPTGIALADGGAYVSQQPNMMFLKDNDGDGRADQRDLILHGFDSADSHHALSAFRFGPGGDLYFMEGTFHHTQVETPYGPTRVKNAGVFRYEPRTEKLDIFVSYGFANPWGICWDRWGQNFVADASPGANYFAAAFSGRVNYPQKHPALRQFLTKQWRPTCGCVLVSSRNFPDEMQGDYLLNNCIGFLGTLRYKMREDGSGFAADPQDPLLRSSDPNFRPTDMAFGPDGALYICDWFNPLIGHMQHSIRDPNRDHNHGRIWRVSYKNKPLVARPKIAGQPIPALLDLLKTYEDSTRNHARLELRQYDTAKVMAELERWLAGLDPKDPQHEHLLLEALWVCQQHDVVNESLLRRLLRGEDYLARAAATRVLCYWRDRVSRPIELLRAQVNDAHPRVRLEAIRAVSFLDGPEAQALALEALAHPTDYYIDYTFKETMATLGPVANAFQPGKLPPERLGTIIRLVCQQGNAGDIEKIWRQCQSADGFPPDVRAAALEALAEAAAARRITPKGNQAGLKNLIKDGNASVQAAAIGLAGVWKVAALRPELEQLALSAGAASSVRQSAMDALALLGGKESRAILNQLLDQSQPVPVRYQAVAALAKLDVNAAADQAAQVLAQATDADDPAPLLAAFLDLKGGSDKLGAAIAKSKLSADVAKLGLRYLNGAGRSDAGLVGALSQAAGIQANPKPPTDAEVNALVEEVQKKGNAARGELVFRRADLNCFKCHALNGAGGEVGPDLKDIGQSSPHDYIVRSILMPDQAIKEQYETIVVTTTDGKIYHGILQGENREQVVLKDAQGQVRTIARRDVDERVKGKSLMPVGLANFMTRAELVDVVRFLGELGKPGDYNIKLEPTVRRWRVLSKLPPALAASVPDDKLLRELVLQAGDAQWNAAYARVSGELPWAELVPAKGPKVLYLQGEIDVRTPGAVGLKLDSAAGLSIWIDGRPLKPAEKLVAGLDKGRHKIVVRLDPAQRQVPTLRLDLVKVDGSKAEAHVVGGP